MRLKSYELPRFINWNVVLCVSHNMASKNCQLVTLICIMYRLCVFYVLVFQLMFLSSFGVNSLVIISFYTIVRYIVNCLAFSLTL